MYANVWVWVGKSSHGIVSAISHQEVDDTQGDNMVSLILSCLWWDKNKGNTKRASLSACACAYYSGAGAEAPLELI